MIKDDNELLRCIIDELVNKQLKIAIDKHGSNYKNYDEFIGVISEEIYEVNEEIGFLKEMTEHMTRCKYRNDFNGVLEFAFTVSLYAQNAILELSQVIAIVKKLKGGLQSHE